MAISQRVAKLSLIFNGVLILLLAFACLFGMVQAGIANRTAEVALYENSVARINKYNTIVENSKSRLLEAKAQK